MLSKPLQYSECQDVERFLRICAKGELYEYILDEVGNPKLTRNKTKKMILTTMYEHYDTTNPWSLEHLKEFKSVFPNVYKGYMFFKQQDYSGFPVMMQRIESRIIKRVAKKIHSRLPGQFFLTVHDCIVTTKKAVSLVEEIMTEEFEKGIGLRPSLKTGLWR